ncbi:DNA polymerase III chi subunit [Geothermobacter ehrlichii]|uniref:DNA polymerase III chi subunit n=1 Tax=Geothermobacter ehrlichii TaxID=213224 RepID=A0A5D3WL02_9BACT|nr:DNA polymerase III subunit chi [Geothermobacter ehrlichii]TYO99707.1 DNA polymerase III chi subunit [Geothermobacter ehrlichii]
MTRVFFCKLDRPEKALHLCRVAERFFLQGKRVLVMVADENQGVTLDRFMWTWNKGSFLPHVYDNGAVECHDEPVVISCRTRNANNAGVLVMGRPCEIDFMRQFETVVDFAETHDEAARQRSRQRFRQYREAGFEPAMLE